MTDTHFDFRMRQNLKASWQLYKQHLWYFVGLAGVMLVLNIVFNSYDGILVDVLAAAAILIWSYVSLSSALAAADGKAKLLEFDAIKLHLPSMRQFWRFAGVVFGSGIIIGAGLILLVLPGVYFAVRLMTANFALVDRREGVRDSLRFSWNLVRRDIFWTALLAFVIAAVLVVFGVAVALLGVLVTYPVALLFLARLYRALIAHHHTAVAVQPAELEAPQTNETAS